MIRRTIAVSAIAALTLGLTAPVATAAPDPESPKLKPAEATLAKSLDKGPVLSLGRRSGQQLYIVQLEDAAVPAYSGGVKGLAPVQAEGRTFSPDAARERSYRKHIVSAQATLRQRISDITGRAAKPRFTYTDALNGIAISMTRAEARQVADLDGVAAVQVDRKRQLQTDVGPEWIGAPSIWDGSATPSGDGTKGEGVVAGILDSGINAANPSFADSVPAEDGGDGYDHTNPRGAGNYVGVCDSSQPFYNPDFECSDKLIGAWDFDDRDDADVGYGYDENGHGSHTASTTAGNQVDATTYSTEETEEDRFSATRNIKGVAPHANIIAYDVCAGGCSMAAITAAIDQAIADEVDVINYSIGGGPSNPWSDPDSLGFLNARAAGIHVATSAGNDGPGASTLGSPADSPWITSVGATQHNRQWQASVENITADGAETLPDIQGLAFANATDGTAPLVYAGDIGSALCIDGELDEADVTGNIIVCDRGQTGRVEKGEVVAALGAAGMILANDEGNGGSLNADPHALPAVHISFADGVTLKDWMAGVEGEQASLSGGQEVIEDRADGPPYEIADIMAGFSSRGPNPSTDIIGPSLSAPGVDVLAAEGADNEVVWGFISGTSMASPHVAGSLALLAGEHPEWTAPEAQSALMTTSVTAITDNDGTAADWFDMGSGRADLTKAADAGLVLDVTEEEYLAADPAAGGDAKELNTASMANRQCLQTCSWTRTVTATETGAGAWTAAGSGVTGGIEVSVEPASFTLAEGETQEISISADVTDAPTDAYQFGTVELASAGDAPDAHLPVAALPSNGVIPTEIDIDTRRDAGSQESDEIQAVEITDLDIQANGLVPADVEELSIPQDETNDDPFNGDGVEVVNVEVPEGATRFVAKLNNATAPDFDLFVGQGETPSEATLVADSASGGSNESVDFALGEGDEGTWWILVQNWEASEAGTDTVDLEHVVVAGDEGNLRAEGPASQPAGEPFTIRTFWDEPEMDAGETWYGSLSLSTAPGGSGIGTIPVTVNRLGDDVTKSVDAETAAPGDTLTYTVDVQPNVTPEDLTYTFEDTLPEGTTYVDGSGPEGATFEDGVLSWETTMPSPVGAEGDYEVTTSTQDEECVNPATGTAGYLDLAGLGIDPQPGVVGDGVLFTGFTGDSFGLYEGDDDGLSFSDDGFLSFGDGYEGNVFINQQLPDPTSPNNLLAMLWQDMQFVYDEPSGAGVTLASGGALKIIEFDDMRLFRDDEGALGTTDFEVVTNAGSRDYAVAFDNVEGPMSNVTIGTENADGSKGTALVNGGNAEGVIEDGMVVCMSYDNTFPVKQFTYQLTVDQGVSNGQVLSNQLVHTVDNPGAEAVTVSRDVTVEGAARLPWVKVFKKRDAKEPRRDGVVVFRRPAWAKGERLTVNYRVGGSARRGRDYRGLDGTVTFRKRARATREFVRVVNRRGRQRTRVVRLVITPDDAYQVGRPKRARVRILDKRRRRR